MQTFRDDRHAVAAASLVCHLLTQKISTQESSNCNRFTRGSRNFSHQKCSHPNSSQRNFSYPSFPSPSFSRLMFIALLLATAKLSLTEPAIAQTIHRDSETGAVRVDNNAFDINTGPLEDSSNIPLPADLLGETYEHQAQPVVPGAWSPNSIEMRLDTDYIDRSFNQLLNQGADSADYSLEPESLQMKTRFNLGHRTGDHNHAEGIQVTVFGPEGAVRSRQTAFVSGDKVTIGPDGQPLPAAAELDVTYGADEVVELRVLNVRKDGAAPSESGIYFGRDGRFVVEDLQNGGDLDFNDGDYVQVSSGQGSAQTLAERSNIAYETQVEEIPLDPQMRQTVESEAERSSELIETDVVTEISRDWGQIELPETTANRLGHARAARAETGETLVYDRYSGVSQLRLGSDGAGLTSQVAPLVRNPRVPPTLITGNVTVDPTVSDNEASLTATLGMTQFLNSTHRAARDVFGNEIVANSGSTLLEPAGLFTNRRMVGYVPDQQSETILGTQLTSVNGVFEIPADQSVTISPPDPQQVGRGNAAYTDNVGGLLIEKTAGTLEFVPQWTASGYAQAPIVLAAGEAQRIIYALVPQQPGQALQLGQRYLVNDRDGGYRIAEGDFTIISADRQPQNFLQERVEVYAVEDTLPGRNAVTATFNGIQGEYVEEPGGDRLPTVDIALPNEADARVGNSLLPTTPTTAQPGQRAYAETTIAAGVYLGGSFTTGIGNQRDTLTLMNTTMQQETDIVRTSTTTNTFATPLTQMDSVLVETTEIAKQSGTASFDINTQGELDNASFGDSEILESDTSSRVLERTSRLQMGEEFLLSSKTTETVQQTEPRITMVEQDISDKRESYANFAPLQGEIALGAVLNFGNTPWSPAANTVRAELFARDNLVGRNSDSETGWRAELVFHPFGERRREAFGYSETGDLVPIYRTTPVLDTNGERLIETIATADGRAVEMTVNQFVLDEAGNVIAQTTGTGRPKGPGLYLRAEDVFSGEEGIVFAGGIQFNF